MINLARQRNKQVLFKKKRQFIVISRLFLVSPLMGQMSQTNYIYIYIFIKRERERERERE